MKREVPRLSPSIAHKLTTESALSAWANHRLLGNHREPASTSQMEGRMWHAAILGEDEEIVVVDVADFKTKAARDERDTILAQGKIPVAAPKIAELQDAAARIVEELAKHGIILNGACEERIEWTEYTEGGAEVKCSGILDHYNGAVIHDLKTGKTATSIHQAAMLIARSHALLQDAAYRSAVCDGDDIDPERIEVVFAFVQTREPFSVTPVTLAGDFRELSHLRWRRAIEEWHKCLSKGTEREHWPDVTEGITPVSAPGWMISQEIELEAMRDEV